MLFVAPSPCGAVRIAADCKEAAADFKPNMTKSKTGIADGRCHLPIRNCQVMCIVYTYVGCSHCTCRQGGGSILVVIKPNTIAENFTTQRHSQ